MDEQERLKLAAQRCEHCRTSGKPRRQRHKVQGIVIFNHGPLGCRDAKMDCRADSIWRADPPTPQEPTHARA